MQGYLRGVILRTLLPLYLGFGLPAEEIADALYCNSIPSMEQHAEIGYSESLEEIENPGRGFYEPVCIHYREGGNEKSTFAPRLLHMRLDLSEFSKAYNKTADKELSQDMLKAFDDSLAYLESRQSSVILRFSYDPWFSGEKSCEPDMEMILKHIRQLGERISRHAEAVTVVECGMFGLWGEMHGSALCTQENFNRVIDCWLEVLPETVTVSLRTPAQYCGWAGIKPEKIAEDRTQPGQRGYRIGIYDDGYLGSDSDLGTYLNRERELEWLRQQTGHALFGGEIVESFQDGKVRNTAAYMAVEAFATHTSYLNLEWNEEVLEAMKRERYTGADERYAGQSGFTYIRNHLGYRFVVREVRMPLHMTARQNLGIEVKIENVGFANLVKPKKTWFLICGPDIRLKYSPEDLETSRKEYMLNVLPGDWESGDVTKLKASLDLPDDLPAGKYSVYLGISGEDPQGGENVRYPVRFANEDNHVWNKSLSANYLGSFELEEEKTGIRMEDLFGQIPETK